MQRHSAAARFLDASPEFRARVKLAVKGLSFYAPDGNSVDIFTFIDAVKNFDPDALDDDLSTLCQSKVAPDTPASSSASAKRSRA